MIRGKPALLPVAGQNRLKVQRLHKIIHQVDRMVRRQPLAQRRRQQQQLVGGIRPERLRHHTASRSASSTIITTLAITRTRLLANRVQLTTDGLSLYLQPIEDVFGGQIDYAMLVKIYGADPAEEPHRYSPPTCTSTRSTRIAGDPDPAQVSTSYADGIRFCTGNCAANWARCSTNWLGRRSAALKRAICCQTTCMC